MATALRLDAPAKLNLSLRVTGRRPDGFHELDSTLVLLELADRLLALPGSSGLRLDGRGADSLPLDASNLAWRGLLTGHGSPPRLTCLTLEKRIPIGAGMGGGSSDAAAAWRLGRRLRGAPEAAGPPDLRDLAGIGADVPFFAAAHARARVRGIGELVRRLPGAERQPVVLVHPPFALSTAAVFAELRREEWGTVSNDLLPAALRLRPELRDILELVTATAGRARLSGSGPTLFMLPAGDGEAVDVAGRLVAAGLDVSVTRTRAAAATIESITEEE